MNAKVLYAVFKRNFVSYFANPTGYVFICVFVLLSSVAAFLPNDFFNANLANLDQLNSWFPLIMLVFIPAITMSIWADERRQGTDELLLTIPASDFDIVLGKYLATVAIYTASLVFSLICNYIVLEFLGNPDRGLFLCTYLGYWFIGLTMLSVGMVASFLTGNLTVAYILGALLNAPLVALQWIDIGPLSGTVAEYLEALSLNHQFEPFGRGLIALPSIIYFLAIALVMLYLSMVLIGRRHWTANQRFQGAAHYSARVISLLIIALGLFGIAFQRVNLRADWTDENLSSLSPETYELLGEIDPPHTIIIEAFVSPEVPEQYVQTKLDLMNLLKEIKASAGEKVFLRINQMEATSEKAIRAEDRYGIQPRPVGSIRQGTVQEQEIFLGIVFKCGLQTVQIPFLEHGLSVEYEILRGLLSVTDQQKKRIGILTTDAQLFGQFNMQTMTPGRNWPIVEDLQKQYEVVQVDPTNPITETFDALVAVQPSSLEPEPMNHFIAAVRGGQPTVIFEDAMPVFVPQVPGTNDPKRPPQQMMFQRQQPPPKGDIQPLWDLLGVEVASDRIVWQDYNPSPRLNQLPDEFVFIDRRSGDGQDGRKPAFNPENPISRYLEYVLLPFPSSMTGRNAASTKFEPLIRTNRAGGYVLMREMRQMSMFGPAGLNPNRRHVPESSQFVLAAQVTGEVESPMPPSVGEEAEQQTPEKSKLNVVVVGDIDMLTEQFYQIRQQANLPGAGVNLNFDNITFVLNAIDAVAGDMRFIEIRSRRPRHRTLQKIDARTEEARKKTAQERESIQEEFDNAVEEEEEKLQERLDAIQERMEQENVSTTDILTSVASARKTGQDRIEKIRKELAKKRDRKLKRIESDLQEKIKTVQGWFKFWAIVLPPIPPLFLAVFVWGYRSSREKRTMPRVRRRS